MALTTQNTDAISFKKLSGKAHTDQNFAATEESIGSNISLSYGTIFGSKINPTPATSGLTSIYASDGVVELVKFQIDIIPNTLVGTNQSQGYRLKLPSDYSGHPGKLYPRFVSGTYLHTALGKLQVVPPLYGTVKLDGSTEYDPILYQTDGVTAIPKFDPINWYFDYYNGILFVQNPPAGYDVSPLRPGFLTAYLFVGKYVDQAITGITASSVSWGSITGKPLVFPPALPIPFTGVTGLQTALNNYIPLSQKGAPNGVAPLNSVMVIPSQYLPSGLKEEFVVQNYAARTAKFVASGTTGTTAQTVSFPGLRVFMIDATGTPEPPTGSTGSSEFIDTTGFLNWARINDQTQVVLDWTNITGKPPLVNQITNGGGLSITNNGTGYTSISTLLDGTYLENLPVTGRVSIIPNSIDRSRLAYQAGSGVTGQYLILGTNNTFNVVSLPSFGVTGLTAVSGVTNLGTSAHPILVAQADIGNNTITVTTAGIKVTPASIGFSQLNLGSGINQFNAYQLPINTGSTYHGSTDVGHAIEKLYTGITQNTNSITGLTAIIAFQGSQIANLQLVSLTGGTNVGSGEGTILRNLSSRVFNLKTIKHGQNISIQNNGSDITISVTGISATTGSSGTIGLPEFGTQYLNGIYTDFVPSTRVGVAVDRFNQLFLLVLPSQPANLSSINSTSSFVSGNLSWGVSRNDIAYVNVGTNAGNPAVDINGTYTAGGTRLGMINASVTGILNSSVVGNITGIPFLDHAFPHADQGSLKLYRNGLLVSQLSLSGTTAATSNNRMSVSGIQFVKATNGSPISAFKYRTGTYTIPTSGMSTGYNYFKIIHSGSSFAYTTNFLEFIYDSDATNITASSTGLTNVSLTGSKNVSGVKFHTSGTIQYQATVANAYKNVYSSLSNAIDFPSRNNLGAITNMSVNGAGIVPRTGGTLQTLPPLNISASNPQNTSISILATLPISSNVVVGSVGTVGKLSSALSISHPFTAQQIVAGGLDNKTGFLFYNVTQGNILNSEDYTGEVNRLQAQDYSLLTYANVNSGTYAWDSTQSLIGGNALYNTGLLRFNGELMYPNAAYLTTQYGITTGNFAAVTNSPAGNVNYTTATGTRSDYRKFTSANGTTQSTITITIDHTGTSTDFLTNGGTGGSPSGNNIKLEFLIMRSNGEIHGWANPFASTGNPEGIANLTIGQAGSITTVSATLSTVPRIGIGDIVVVRIFAASGYTNRINTLSITNI
jgi:hypothetical protein